MRLNRRTLLTMLAAVPAVAALAPKAVEAEPVEIKVDSFDKGVDLSVARQELMKQANIYAGGYLAGYEQALATGVYRTFSRGGHALTATGDVMLSPTSTLVLRDGQVVDLASGMTVEACMAAREAQARADGYNRGREVEMAAQESRAFTAYHNAESAYTRLTRLPLKMGG